MYLILILNDLKILQFGIDDENIFAHNEENWIRDDFKGKRILKKVSIMEIYFFFFFGFKY